MVWALIAVPALAGAACFFIRDDRFRRGLLLASAALHAGLTAAAWGQPLSLTGAAWVAIGPAALYFLSLTSLLFLVASIYAVGYLSRESHEGSAEADEPVMEGWRLLHRSREAVFTACLLLFLASMSLVITSQHVGLLWVAVEATTLASAPLIFFHRQRRSLEATWKYLVICSVGIALALLGNFFLVVAASFQGPYLLPLTVTELVSRAHTLHPVWLKAAFLLFLVGYGTKMGLVPLHTWLPDAHSEAPSVVSALLSGALLNCAFLALLRLGSVLGAAGLGRFTGELLVGFGLISVAAAAAFLIRQADYKRLLAYSSVEHMGLLALGAGLGGVGGVAALLQAGTHTLAKGMLFLAAGNILLVYRTKATGQVGGLLRRLPVTGPLWVAGLLAITGTPPFGTFTGKLLLLKGAVEAGRWWIAGGTLFALAAAFGGMSAVMLRMAFGRETGAAGAPAGERSFVHAPTGAIGTASNVRVAEPLWSVLPLLILGAAVLVLGLYLPPPLAALLERAAGSLLGAGPGTLLTGVGP